MKATAVIRFGSGRFCLPFDTDIRVEIGEK